MNTTIPSHGQPMVLDPVTGGINFKPFYTPIIMLQLGIHGGTFGSKDMKAYYKLPNAITKPFPPAGGKVGRTGYAQAANYFNITTQQSDRVMAEGNNIYKLKHPLGWFEWYIRYYYGEKSLADRMRVTQWYIGINTAWWYIRQDPSKLLDLTWQVNRRQDLLEWGADPTVDPASYGCGDDFS